MTLGVVGKTYRGPEKGGGTFLPLHSRIRKPGQIRRRPWSKKEGPKRSLSVLAKGLGITIRGGLFQRYGGEGGGDLWFMGHFSPIDKREKGGLGGGGGQSRSSKVTIAAKNRYW